MQPLSNSVYVLDTNVLIHDPDFINSFSDCEIVIPFQVIEELDKLKKKPDITGYIARLVSKKIEEIVDGNNLREGVKVGNNVIIKILDNNPNSSNNIDNQIINLAYSLSNSYSSNINIIFVSKDVNARLKARALGLKAIDYDVNDVDTNNLYLGYSTLSISPEIIKEIYTEGKIKEDKIKKEIINKPIENQFFIFKSYSDSSSVLTQYRDKEFRLIKSNLLKIDNIKPKNKEQTFALQLLLDDSIPIVSLQGPSGTGKTFLALATALQKTLESQKYSKIMILKPIIPIGRDIGYLPGSVDSKLEPWIKSYLDNLQLLISDYEYLFESGIIETEAITFLRGRSINNTFVILDELQNITPQILKTIMSRIGFNSKIVLLGDIQQIDSPYLNMKSNALTYLITKLKGNKYFGHINLHETIRSKVSEIAVNEL